MAENTPNNPVPIRQRIQNQQDKGIEKEQLKNYESNTENRRQYALAEDRAARAGDAEVARIGTSINPPSSTRYIIALSYAILLDILDIVEDIADLTGVGILATIILDIILDLPLIWLGFKSSKELKQIGIASSGVTEKINTIRQKTQEYRNRYALLLRASRKVGVLRRPVRQVAKKFKAVRKIITKSVLGRYIWTALADMIPFVDLIPFRTWGLYASFKQQRLAYTEFQLLIAEDYTEARAEEVEATNDILALEQEEEEEEIQE